MSMLSTYVNKFHFSGLVRVKERNYYVMLGANEVQNWIRSGLKIQTDFMENTVDLAIPVGCGMKMDDNLFKKK